MQPFDGKQIEINLWIEMGHTDGHGTYGRTWDGHGTYGRTWDIRTDMGHTDGHWDIRTDIFGQRDILYCSTLEALAAKLEGT